MSPLPSLPAAPAPSNGGIDLRESPAASSRAQNNRERGDQTFEDALAQSVPEETEPSDSREDALADAGIAAVLPMPAPQTLPQLDLAPAVCPAADGILSDTRFANADLKAEVGFPLIPPGAQGPSIEQPLPISKPLAQALYSAPAGPGTSPIEQVPTADSQRENSVSGGATSVGSGIVALSRPDATVTSSAVATNGNDPHITPANPAGSDSGKIQSGGAEQNYPNPLASNSDREEKNASLGAVLERASSASGDQEGVSATRQTIPVGRGTTGTDGAETDRRMSSALIHPSRPATSRREGVESAVLTPGTDLEESLAVGARPVEMVSQAVFTPPAASAPVSQPQGARVPEAAATRDAARILEHIETTLARYRPNVPPHLEVRVDLQGGDSLQVRLDLRGDALLSTFRTDSPELRLALQRAWPEFAERSQQNGLNLSPASFDSPGMSSDSGSQAGGRQQGSRESDGPLPEAFRRAPGESSKKTPEPARGPRESAGTRWA